MKVTTLAIALTLLASNAQASCYGLTGYALVNCLTAETDREQHRIEQRELLRYGVRPYEGLIDNRQTCLKERVDTPDGNYYFQTICK